MCKGAAVRKAPTEAQHSQPNQGPVLVALASAGAAIVLAVRAIAA